MKKNVYGLIIVNSILAVALLSLLSQPTDEVVYIVTSPDKQAELRIPLEALPDTIDVLDISIAQTATGYKITPENLVFLAPVKFTY